MALGVDAAAADPESPLEVTRRRLPRGGRDRRAATGCPCVVVQEGGYDLASIGGLVLAALEGLEEGRTGMPEPLSVWIGKEEYGGVPTPTRRGPSRAASLAARGDRRDRAAALARTLAPTAARSLSSRTATRPTSGCSSSDRSGGRAADDGARPDAVLGGHDARALSRRHAGRLRERGLDLARGERRRSRRASWSRRAARSGSAPTGSSSPSSATPQSRLAVIDVGRPLAAAARARGTGARRATATRGGDGLARRSYGRLRLSAPRRPQPRATSASSTSRRGEARGAHRGGGHRDAQPTWSPDGGTLAFSAQRGEWYALHLVDVAAGTERRSRRAPRRTSRSCGGARTARRLAAIRSRGGRHDLVTIDVATGEIGLVPAAVPRVRRAGPPTARSSSPTRITRPRPELRLVAPDGAIEVLLAPAPRAVVAAPHVTPEEVCVHVVRRARDPGVAVPPGGARARSTGAGRRLPARRPDRVYGDEWDGHAQYFVDKGYAWLALNFRGSTGRGQDFERLNFDDWGGGDMRDCLAAADFLRTLDVGRRRAARRSSVRATAPTWRCCCAVEDAGERFRCAVCKYGDCDLLTTWSQGDRDGVLYCGENMLGHPVAQPRGLAALARPSPRVDRVAVPLLIATGERDERVHPRAVRRARR